MCGMRWHVEHRDGREWTRDELTEIVRIQREHDDVWPYDAGLIAVSIDPELNVYLLDSCMAWHRMDETLDGEDVRLVFG